MESGEGNSKGFWENQRLADIHEAFLQDLGHSWQSFSALDLSVVDADLRNQFKERISIVLEQEFSQCACLCIKDPRLSRLLPLWLEICNERDLTPRALLISREPVEVVASLKARNALSEDQGYAMWLRYVLDSFRHTSAIPRFFTTYVAVLNDLEGELARASKELDLPFYKTPVECNHLVVKELRHHVSSRLVVSDAYHWSRNLYKFLREPKPHIPDWYSDYIMPLVEYSATQGAQFDLMLANNIENTPDSIYNRSPVWTKLTTELDESKIYSRSLQRELDISQDYNSSMREDLDSSREYAESLQAELESRDEFAMSLQSTLKNKVNELNQRKNDYKKETTRREEYTQSLLTELEKMSDIRRKNEEDITRREEYTQSLITELDKTKNIQRLHQEDIARREEYTQSLITELGKANNIRSSLEEDLKSMLKENQSLLGELDKLKLICDQQANQNQQTQEELESLRKKFRYLIELGNLMRRWNR